MDYGHISYVVEQNKRDEPRGFFGTEDWAPEEWQTEEEHEETQAREAMKPIEKARTLWEELLKVCRAP